MNSSSAHANVAAAIALACTCPACAIDEQHVVSAGPVEHCQAALPVFETGLRKRPLALGNEGPKTAFVTCSFAFDVGQVVRGSVELEMVVTNSTTRAVDLLCTAISSAEGLTGELAPEYAPQRVTIAARSQSQLYWAEVGFSHGLSTSGLVSVSCAVPVGVGLNDTYIGWIEDDAGA
jgi:hypothetical protein